MASMLSTMSRKRWAGLLEGIDSVVQDVVAEQRLERPSVHHVAGAIENLIDVVLSAWRIERPPWACQDRDRPAHRYRCPAWLLRERPNQTPRRGTRPAVLTRFRGSAKFVGRRRARQSYFNHESTKRGRRREAPFSKAKPLSLPCASGIRVVARDGIEPPTPAFSGLRSTD